ncbi:hypothetical protein [Arthrobacter sp. R4-81]
MGGLTSPVSSVTSAAADALSAVPPHSPAADPSPAFGSRGLLQPPDDAVTNVTSPVRIAAEGAVGGLAEAVIPPVTEAIPVLQPVLAPVADVISGGHVTLPEPVAGVVTEFVGQTAIPGPDFPDVSDAAGDPEAALPDIAEPSASAAAPNVTAAFATGATGRFWSASMLAHTSGGSGVSGQTGPPDGSNGPPGPETVPAVPGSGSGSGQSSGGSSGGAACLTDVSLNLPQPGSTAADGPPQHAPAPVSLDPGSSPD